MMSHVFSNVIHTFRKIAQCAGVSWLIVHTVFLLSACGKGEGQRQILLSALTLCDIRLSFVSHQPGDDTQVTAEPSGPKKTSKLETPNNLLLFLAIIAGN